MAVNLPGPTAGNYYDKTAFWASADLNTSMMWLYPTSIPSAGNYHNAFGMPAQMMIDLHGSLWSLGSSASDQDGSTATANVWAHLTMVKSAATTCTMYLNGVSDAVNTDNNSNQIFSIGNWAGGNDMWAGRVAAVKCWDAALTADEIKAEMRQYLPVRRANLKFYNPFWAVGGNELTDYSGNGQTLAKTGTGQTTVDGPPIGWRRRRTYIFVPSAGGTTYEQAAAGTLTTAGALVLQTSKPLAGTLTTAGSLVNQVGKITAGTLTTSGSLVNRTNKVLAGTLTTAGSLLTSFLATLNLAGTLTTAGALVNQTNKVLAGTLTSAGSLVNHVNVVLAGTLTTAGTLAKQVGKPVAGTLTSSGTLLTSFLASLSLSGTLTTAGALVTRTNKVLAGTLTTAGSLVNRVNVVLAGTLTTAGTLANQVNKVLAGTLTTAGGLTTLLVQVGAVAAARIEIIVRAVQVEIVTRPAALIEVVRRAAAWVEVITRRGG